MQEEFLLKRIIGPIYVPAISAGTDAEYPLCKIEHNAILEKVVLIFQDDVSGADTNYFTAKIRNKGTDGTGTTVLVSKAYTDGVDSDKFTAVELTPSSETSISAGSVLAYMSDQEGTGINDPAKVVIVYLK